tara:strand:- start:3198 stop:3518 length:321 start_codon:yes stop_codon:yes gene_type:complete
MFGFFKKNKLRVYSNNKPDIILKLSQRITELETQLLKITKEYYQLVKNVKTVHDALKKFSDVPDVVIENRKMIVELYDLVAKTAKKTSDDNFLTIGIKNNDDKLPN